LAANAASLGAIVHKPTTTGCLAQALAQARAADRTTVIYVPVDPLRGVPGYDSWWDVPVAEVSDQSTVRAARSAWQSGKKRQRYFL
jgi:3D-(3,5/4)-trihydroxycyclohexane-1,2-dione acylhydrolase (decyclizing)